MANSDCCMECLMEGALTTKKLCTKPSARRCDRCFDKGLACKDLPQDAEIAQAWAELVTKHAEIARTDSALLKKLKGAKFGEGLKKLNDLVTGWLDANYPNDLIDTAEAPAAAPQPMPERPKLSPDTEAIVEALGVVAKRLQGIETATAQSTAAL
ncbi:hypothetical protein KEM56_000658, partial [Ascosphaera pollenicola]